MPAPMKTILVTGVGAIIGYGLLRAFRGMAEPVRLVGCDIFPDAVGQAWCDDFVVAPPTAGEGYLDWLFEVIGTYRVDLVVPAIEQDVQRLSAARERFAGGRCQLAINDRALIELSSDKWAMHEALADVDEALRIPSRLEGGFDDLAGAFGLPFLLKPRRGYASKGLLRIHDRARFDIHAAELGRSLMAQPIVGCDDAEYSVGVFGDGAGGVAASICLRRRLAADGSTAKAWVQDEPSLDASVAALCRRFRPLGPTNLQFRKDGDGWKLLEINPRVSSSTSIRTAFGFSDAEMLHHYHFAGRLPVQPRIRPGFVARFIEDHVVYDRPHF